MKLIDSGVNTLVIATNLVDFDAFQPKIVVRMPDCGVTTIVSNVRMVDCGVITLVSTVQMLFCGVHTLVIDVKQEDCGALTLVNALLLAA